MFMNFCILVAISSVLLYNIKQALERRSYVYLEILSSCQCTQIRLTTLPDATRRYVVRVSSSVLTIKLRYFYVVGILHVMTKPPKIVNNVDV
jgi:hypothetical protein